MKKIKLYELKIVITKRGKVCTTKVTLPDESKPFIFKSSSVVVIDPYGSTKV